MDISDIGKELSLIASNASSILRREVMEADCHNFAELSDKMATNILIRSARLLKEIDPEGYIRQKWIQNELGILRDL